MKLSWNHQKSHFNNATPNNKSKYLKNSSQSLCLIFTFIKVKLHNIIFNLQTLNICHLTDISCSFNACIDVFLSY